MTGRPPSARAATEAWLRAQGVAHDALHFVDKYARYPDEDALPVEALAQHGYDVAIEDSPEMAARLTAQGVRVLLFSRPWNLAAPPVRGVERVADWQTIAERLAAGPAKGAW